jgi:hypothetical protein
MPLIAFWMAAPVAYMDSASMVADAWLELTLAPWSGWMRLVDGRGY